MAAILFWPRAGSLATIVTTAAFFSCIGLREFPYIALLNLIPIPFVLVAWTLRPGAGVEGSHAPPT